MKKILIIAGVAFLVSLAAGAGGRMALAPPPAEEGGPGAEGAVAALNDQGGPSTPGGPHADARTAESRDPAGSTDPGRDVGAPRPGGHGDPSGEAAAIPAAAGNLSSGEGDQPLEFREMGHILASMKPNEAGMFLSYLDDDRAMALLRAMNVGDAAAILAKVPGERKDRLKARFMAMLMESE